MYFFIFLFTIKGTMTVYNNGYASLDEVWGDITGRKKKKKTQQDPICDLYEMKGSSSAYSETDLLNYAYDKTRSQRTAKDNTPKPTKQYVDIEKEQDNYESKQLPNSLFEKQFEIRHPQNFDMDDPREYMVRSCPSKNTRDDEGDDVYDDEVVRRQSPPQTQPQQQQQQQPLQQRKLQTQEYLVTQDESPRASRYTKQEQPIYSDDETDEEDYVEPVQPERRQHKTRQERKKRIYHYDDDIEEEYYSSMFKKPPSTRHVYLDIILYILSGIILIFLLEQFVRIGINMQTI
jgi:hypothetical protein